MSLNFIDLFAGIGGIRLGFEGLFGKCVFSSEWDKYAQITYEANFGHKPAGDITQIDEKDIPSFDILLAGFPCQPFSNAGLKKGFEDTRGTLFFHIARIINYHKPKIVFLENVKGLKTHDEGRTIKVIYHELHKLGYKVTDRVLNTMEYGNLPQNRERIYIVGFLDQDEFNSFEFPAKAELKTSIHDCLESCDVDEKYYYNNKQIYGEIKDFITKKDTVYQWRRKYVRENKNGVCPTLTANMGTGGHNVPLILNDKGIRKLTPRECANFQGFPSDFKLPNISDSHLYQQFGNSVSVSVIKKIAEQIKLSLN